MTRMMICSMGIFAVAAAGLGGCDTEPKSDADRQALTSQSQGVVGAFTSTDSTLRDLMGKSSGYAVFPDVGKAGFILGGAYGRGQVYEHGALIGYADITQGSIGPQIGAQSYDELVIFMTQGKLDDFKKNQFTFSANASAVAVKPGAGAAADYSGGVAVFIKPRGGVMAEASIGGQQFNFKPLGAVTTTTTTTTTSQSSK